MNAPALPVFGPALADCANCELAGQCRSGKSVTAELPTEPFNGIMFVGEGPGATEVSQRRPFVGPSGRLLNALLEAAGIRREASWITNATLCFPPRKTAEDAKRDFHDRFPAAVYSCLPRLEKEIALIRPRVIVALGQAALVSIAGYEVTKARRVPQNCIACDPADRKIGPVIACAVGTCNWFAHVVDDVHAKELKAQHDNKCPTCTASIKKLKPRRIKCPACGGTKTREEMYTTFEHDHKLMEIAGGLLDASKLPSQLDQLGVKWVIPTYHPAFCLHAMQAGTGRKFGGQYAARAMLDHFEKALRIAKGAEPRFDLSLTITDEPADVDEYCADETALYTVDIETDSDADVKGAGPFDVNMIKCVGIKRSNTSNALVVDTRGILRGGVDLQGQPSPLAAALYRFCVDARKRKILQNGPYDRVTMWAFWGLPFYGQVADTMIAHQCLYPDEPHKLGHIGYCMTDVEAWKPPKVKNGQLQFKSFEELCIYNARDLGVTDEASLVMGADPRARGRVDLERVRDAYATDMELLDIAIEMTQVGLPVARDALAKVSETTSLALELTSKRINDAIQASGIAPSFIDKKGAPIPFSPGNRDHVRWALFDRSGPFRLTPVVFTEKKREPSTNKDALLKINDHPVVQTLIEWGKHDMTRKNFLEGKGMRVHADGRMRPQWKVGKAVTGRWSSSPNFQNWPKWLRSCIVAPEGRMILGWDYDQLEMRIMAMLSGDPELIRRCMTADKKRKLDPNCDPHSYIASLTFGDTYLNLDMLDPKHVKTKPGEAKCRCETCKRDSLRDVAKRVVYGLNYGAGAATVLEAIYDGGYEGPPLTTQFIDRVIGVYFAAFPRVPIWRDNALNEARRTEEVRCPISNRRRIFPLGEVESTVAYNYPIQSGAGTIMNRQLIVLRRAIPQIDPSARPLAQVHDAVYFEVDAALGAQLKPFAEQHLTTSHRIYDDAPAMVFSGTAKLGTNWQEVS